MASKILYVADTPTLAFGVRHNPFFLLDEMDEVLNDTSSLESSSASNYIFYYVYNDEQIKVIYISRRPYRKWKSEWLISIDDTYWHWQLSA